jgi:glycosyltransferase involved in cell wall biosynthesis
VKIKRGEKILVVSPTPPPFSGPEVMTAQLLSSPLRSAYTLLHFNISKGRDVSTKAQFDWVNIVYGLFQPFQLFWLMLRHRPDVVYTNLAQNVGGFLRYASFILTIALFRKPVVVRLMGDGFQHFYGRSPAWLRWLIRVVLKNVSIFIVRAEVLKSQLKGLVPDSKLRVVHSGIAFEEFTPHVQTNGPVQVLFVGYLAKAKGVFDLLEAVPEVVKQFPDIRFKLMGPKLDTDRNITYVDNPVSNEAVLHSLISRDEIGAHIELLGTQWGEEKIRTFQNADIFVLPSYSEAFPTVVLEAMAAGLPVVATPVGVLPEVFDERNVLFVDPGDVEGLAKAIVTLASDEALRQRMGRLNREMVERRFNPDTYANQLDRIFRDLIRMTTRES